MEAILPLKVGTKPTSNVKLDHKSYDYNAHDLARARMLIYSLEQYWVGKNPAIVHVICPEEEVEATASLLKAPRGNVELKFSSEDTLVPELREYPEVSGWYKQQVLKLSAYKLINSNFFLTLDSDIFACKEFDYNTFFHAGKIVNDWEPRSMHALWWESSAKILGIDLPVAGDGMKPTPVVVSSEVCEKLYSFLQSKYKNQGWRPLLQNLGWTEFSLYNSFLDSQKLAEKFHCTSKEVAEFGLAVRSSQSFSNYEGFNKWNPKKAADRKNPGYFMVCNSISRIHPSEIWGKLQQMFPNPPPYSKFEE